MVSRTACSLAHLSDREIVSNMQVPQRRLSREDVYAALRTISATSSAENDTRNIEVHSVARSNQVSTFDIDTMAPSEQTPASIYDQRAESGNLCDYGEQWIFSIVILL